MKPFSVYLHADSNKSVVSIQCSLLAAFGVSESLFKTEIYVYPIQKEQHSKFCGDGGFFLACEDCGGRLVSSFPTCVFLFLFFLFEVEIS